MLDLKTLAKRAAPGLYARLARLYSDNFKDRRAAFTAYYRENLWGDPESRSGGGSNAAATECLRRDLPGLLARLGVRRLADAPCGDFHWMAAVPLEGVSYHGFDIVAEVIAENRRRHGREGVAFDEADIVTDVLPEADMILSRDALIHLSNRDAARALANFRRSGSRFVALSQADWCEQNKDIVTGGYRPINFRLPPFSFPEPEEALFDGSLENEARHRADTLPDPKHLAVWRLETLAL